MARAWPSLSVPGSAGFIWAAGIEDTFIIEPNRRTGRTLDEYALTQHYERWSEDIGLLADLGVLGDCRPNPRLVGHYATGNVIGVSEGYRRDRGVDESGNQIAIFGRRGSRPFNLSEQQKMYLRGDRVWTVTNDPPGPPRGTRN